MSDFVERLRKEIKFSLPHNTVHIDLLGEAADRIEALEMHQRSMIAAVLGTIGGTVEGHLTSEINYLQRLRQLVKCEDRIEALEAALLNVYRNCEPTSAFARVKSIASAALAPACLAERQEQDK
jgi:hypothetical protein